VLTSSVARSHEDNERRERPKPLEVRLRRWATDETGVGSVGSLPRFGVYDDRCTTHQPDSPHPWSINVTEAGWIYRPWRHGV
jgi:hypothetical protein